MTPIYPSEHSHLYPRSMDGSGRHAPPFRHGLTLHAKRIAMSCADGTDIELFSIAFSVDSSPTWNILAMLSRLLSLSVLPSINKDVHNNNTTL